MLIVEASGSLIGFFLLSLRGHTAFSNFSYLDSIFYLPLFWIPIGVAWRLESLMQDCGSIEKGSSGMFVVDQTGRGLGLPESIGQHLCIALFCKD